MLVEWSLFDGGWSVIVFWGRLHVELQLGIAGRPLLVWMRERLGKLCRGDVAWVRKIAQELFHSRS